MPEILPEIRDLIPPLQSEEYELLEQSIVAEGCRDAILIWQADAEVTRDLGYGVCKDCDYKYIDDTESWASGDGVWECAECGYGIAPIVDVVVDGHNRFEICTKHGIEFQTEYVSDVESLEDVKLWMIENQMGRRNLADIDRIALARVKEDLIRPIAEKARQENQGRPSKLSANLRSVTTKTKTSVETAKIAGVGERTYDAGKLILDAAASGEIEKSEVEAIRRKEKSIYRVAKDIKEKRQKEKRDEERIESAKTVDISALKEIHVGDFREHQDLVPDGSLSLIFTDPPYDRKSEELFEGIGEFAAKKLAVGGSLVCYIGHIQLPKAMQVLPYHLRYWWTLCCYHSEGRGLMTEYGVRVGWKPVLWFVKGVRDNKEDIVQDVMTGNREKKHHDWQQSVKEAEYWISHLCPEDGIVCDLFLGGGTTAVAAKKLNRKWVGFELDENQAKVAAGRIQSDDEDIQH